MVECVLSQLKLSGSSILLAVRKVSAFSTAKNVKLFGLHPIQISCIEHEVTIYSLFYINLVLLSPYIYWLQADCKPNYMSPKWIILFPVESNNPI